MDDNTEKFEKTGGAGAATATAPDRATEQKKLQLVTSDSGDVKLGVWVHPPSGYEPVTDRAQIQESLMIFNATELREKIADCIESF